MRWKAPKPTGVRNKNSEDNYSNDDHDNNSDSRTNDIVFIIDLIILLMIYCNLTIWFNLIGIEIIFVIILVKDLPYNQMSFYNST